MLNYNNKIALYHAWRFAGTLASALGLLVDGLDISSILALGLALVWVCLPVSADDAGPAGNPALPAQVRANLQRCVIRWLHRSPHRGILCTDRPAQNQR